MYKNFFKKNNTKKGFSLVEMLVAIGIFMTIVTIAVSALISIIGANKRAQAIKNTIDSVNFVVETISRELRSGKEYSCVDLAECPSGSNKISYKNSLGNIITYEFKADSDDLLTKKTDEGVPEVLISKDSGVKLDSMIFYVIGTNKDELMQPRVIITASGKIESKGVDNSSFNLQTTVSQRDRK
jgi:type II secretory pathway pseudopilin PulG